MPISGLSIGRDVTWKINTAQGPIVFSQDHITSFESAPDAELKKYLGVSGIITPAVFHVGHSIKMDIVRVGDTLDRYWAVAEAAYFAGIDLPGGMIYETIQEPNGTVSQFVYTNIQLKVDTFGEKTGNNWISIKFSGYAARRELLT
jgi:hypothetical protein